MNLWLWNRSLPQLIYQGQHNDYYPSLADKLMEKCHLNLTAFVKDSLQLHYITFSSITLIKECRVCTLSLCIHTPLNGTPCSHLKMFLRGQTYVSAHRMFCVEEPYHLYVGVCGLPASLAGSVVAGSSLRNLESPELQASHSGLAWGPSHQAEGPMVVVPLVATRGSTGLHAVDHNREGGLTPLRRGRSQVLTWTAHVIVLH